MIISKKHLYKIIVKSYTCTESEWPVDKTNKSIIKNIIECNQSTIEKVIHSNNRIKELEDKKRNLSYKIGKLKKANKSSIKQLESLKKVSIALKGETKTNQELIQKIYNQYMVNIDSINNIAQSGTDNNINVKEQNYDNNNTENISIILLDPGNAIKWNEYVDANINSTIYHKMEILQIINDVFLHRIYPIAAYQNDRIIGVLPLVRQHSHLFGNYIISMPYFNYGGALSDDGKISNELMNEAVRIASSESCEFIEFRDIRIHKGWRNKTHKVAMHLDLPNTINELDKVLGSKIRAQRKRPFKLITDISIRSGKMELLDDFYSVFSQNMRDLGTPVYTKKLFKQLLIRLNDNTNIIIIYIENIPVAAGFLIGYKEKIEIPWASTIKNVNKYSINMLLYWEVLKFSIENNYKIFDFGRSTRNDNTYRFKKQWGAKDVQLYWHYWLNKNQKLPEIDRNNPKYLLMIEAWKRLPLYVANRLGPSISRFLP